MRLVVAGNTLAPAVLLLEARGFAVDRVVDNHGETWFARSAALELHAADPVQLLGLLALADAHGERWQATDAQIADVLRRFSIDPPFTET